MVVLKWNLVSSSNIRCESGVYAWYYSVDIGKYDINEIYNSLVSDLSADRKYSAARDFLEKNLFSYFKEEEYQARIYGQLMPEFRGKLQHISQTSDALIKKIIDKPKLLLELREIINVLSLDFSSPIYIGMSSDLCTRVNHHKQLIEQFKSQKNIGGVFSDRDESFAARVVSRGMIETKLKVALMYIPSDENLHGVVENILNRINYPVLGRN